MREQGCLPDTLINEHENCQKLYGTTDAIDSEAGIDDINRILMKAIEETSIKLICQLHQRYSQYKKRENLVDFNDLELMTVKLLENEDIRMHYFNRFAAIMVDEFQDLNPLQKEILDLLTQKDGHIPPGRLFIVGDYKQSIYGFRGSDYRVFEQACSEISSCGRVENLSNCYRSTENIIEFVNIIFERLLNPLRKAEVSKEQKR